MIDINKKYTTRDGREVKIYSVDNGGDYPVHGALKYDNGAWMSESWTDRGKLTTDGNDGALDLVGIPLNDEEARDVALNFWHGRENGTPVCDTLVAFVRQHGKQILGL